MFIALIVSIGVTPAFAQEYISIAPGSSIPGCEETNKCFIPYQVTMNVGDTVTWSNDDSAVHTITSGTVVDGPDGTFDSGLFMAGAEFSHKFDQIGTYPYFDMVHPWATGLIIVEDTSLTVKAITVKTDKTSYTHNDMIMVTGQVANVSGFPVTIIVVSPLNSIVTIDQLRVDNDGNFETTLDTSRSSWKLDGTYTIKVNYGSAEKNSQVLVELTGAVNVPKQITPPIILGNPNASVTILQFGDFGDIFSKRYYDNTEKQIRKLYVDTNQVKIIWQDYGLFDEKPISNAALCAGEEGKFWDYHDKLFDYFDDKNLERIATELELDMPNWNKCINEKRYYAYTEKRTSPNGDRITGVPTFFISNSTHTEKISGAQSIDKFEEIINKMLNKPIPQNPPRLNVNYSTSPEHITVGDTAKLKIDFINPDTQKIQVHIDFKLTVFNDDEIIFGPTPLTHTAIGSINIPIEFHTEGIHTVLVEIEGILFNPISTEKISFVLIVGPLIPNPPCNDCYPPCIDCEPPTSNLEKRISILEDRVQENSNLIDELFQKLDNLVQRLMSALSFI